MCKIAHKIQDAIQHRKNFTGQNTRVVFEPDTNTTTVWTYRSILAIFNWDSNTVHVYVPSDWPNRTTLNRLWALYPYTHATFHCKRGKIYVAANGIARKTEYREILTYSISCDL